eukprot:6619900-Pyramimonas_sp.AAC.1
MSELDAPAHPALAARKLVQQVEYVVRSHAEETIECLPIRNDPAAEIINWHVGALGPGLQNRRPPSTPPLEKPHGTDTAPTPQTSPGVRSDSNFEANPAV